MEDCQKKSTKKLTKREKISLDNYLDFFFSNQQLDLTVDQLNQIARMHGYMRIKGQKKVTTDAISTIDLVNPCRSTLKENVSSSSSIPLEEIILDLKDLDWQECCVTSVHTFSSWKQNSSVSNLDHQESKSNQNAHEMVIHGAVDAIDGVSTYCTSEQSERSSGPKNKRKITTVQSGAKDGSLDPSSQSSRCSLLPKKFRKLQQVPDL